MRPEALRAAREQWLVRADRDLLIARRAADIWPVLGDAVAYHAQQAAEKSLKAFLVANDTPFPRTHDLVTLLDICAGIEPDFGRLRMAAGTLTPYAVRFRYPGGPVEPAADEAVAALEIAEEIVQFVREQLGRGTVP